MKSVLSEKCCKKSTKYPCLLVGTGTGMVYLMKSDDEGTIVHVPDEARGAYEIGHKFDSLNARSGMYEAYEGDVCLTND